MCVAGKHTLAALMLSQDAFAQEFVLAGVDAAAWPVFIEERTRERKLGTSVSGRILTAGAGAASPPPSTVNSAPARPQPAPRHTDPSFIKVSAPGKTRRFNLLNASELQSGLLWAVLSRPFKL